MDVISISNIKLRYDEPGSIIVFFVNHLDREILDFEIALFVNFSEDCIFIYKSYMLIQVYIFKLL